MTRSKAKTKATIKTKSKKKQKTTAANGCSQYTVAEHGIELAHVDEYAIRVCERLQEADFEAYIVGGAVRDLLLDLRPKDFDVATNATPEEVKKLFRRAFIIGRRFRIVHVVFGSGRSANVIEVTTFRGNVAQDQTHQVRGNERSSNRQLQNIRHAVDAGGRILRDNVWGTLGEDAARRDFTINAMYYDPLAQLVLDYHNGMQDIRDKRIRMIGEANTRYREDPVRMLRAARFAAKLNASGFELAKATAQPLFKLKSLLSEVPPSRMFDEALKLFQTGHALASVEQLRRLQLDSGLYPLQDLIVERADTPLLHQNLLETDIRIAQNKPVLSSFLVACALWEDVKTAWERNTKAGMAHSAALQEAIGEAFHARIGGLSGRGRLSADVREIWSMQPRFERRNGKYPYGLVQQERFRASLNLLRLRAATGELATDLAQWWEDFFQADAAQRSAMQQNLVAGVNSYAMPKRKRRSRRAAPRGKDFAAKDSTGIADAPIKPIKPVKPVSRSKLSTPSQPPKKASE